MHAHDINNLHKGRKWVGVLQQLIQRSPHWTVREAMNLFSCISLTTKVVRSMLHYSCVGSSESTIIFCGDLWIVAAWILFNQTKVVALTIYWRGETVEWEVSFRKKKIKNVFSSVFILNDSFCTQEQHGWALSGCIMVPLLLSLFSSVLLMSDETSLGSSWAHTCEQLCWVSLRVHADWYPVWGHAVCAVE